MTVGIYRIVHIATGREYIGQATNMERRWRDHRRLLDARQHHAKHLTNAWHKYGCEAFVFEMLEECGLDCLTVTEQRYLDDRKPAFNTSRVAGSRRGVTASDETKAKMRAALKGRKQGPRSAEFKAACRARMIGKVHPPETRAKMSETHRINAIWTGRKHSEETRIKIGLASRGRVVSEDVRDKISSKLTGRKMSKESKMKLSASRRALFEARRNN